MSDEQNCAELVGGMWMRTREDLEAYMGMRNPERGDDERGPFNEYALCFDYVAPHTFENQELGYWRYQMSFGGPSDEIRFWGDSAGSFWKAEYWYLDWYDGAHKLVTREPTIKWLWGYLVETGAVKHAYEEGMDGYEEPEDEDEENEDD